MVADGETISLLPRSFWRISSSNFPKIISIPFSSLGIFSTSSLYFSISKFIVPSFALVPLGLLVTLEVPSKSVLRYQFVKNHRSEELRLSFWSESKNPLSGVFWNLLNYLINYAIQRKEQVFERLASSPQLPKTSLISRWSSLPFILLSTSLSLIPSLTNS